MGAVEYFNGLSILLANRISFFLCIWTSIWIKLTLIDTRSCSVVQQKTNKKKKKKLESKSIDTNRISFICIHNTLGWLWINTISISGCPPHTLLPIHAFIFSSFFLFGSVIPSKFSFTVSVERPVAIVCSMQLNG